MKLKCPRGLGEGRDHCLYDLYPSEGYWRFTYMMLDADVVADSPSSVYRVLKAAGLATGQTFAKFEDLQRAYFKSLTNRRPASVAAVA